MCISHHNYINEIIFNILLQFLAWYSQVEEELQESEDVQYTLYVKQLADRRDECSSLLSQVVNNLLIYF